MTFDPVMLGTFATVLGVAFALAVPAMAGGFYVSRLLSRLEIIQIQANCEAKQVDLVNAKHDNERTIAELRAIVDRAHEGALAGNTSELISYLSARGQNVWKSHAIVKNAIARVGPQKIVTFCNNKGGVGKTTLSANFGAHLFEQGKRVLFLDMDYQGSLTNLLAAVSAASGFDTDVSAKWLDCAYSAGEFSQDSRILRYKTRTFSLYPSRYSLATEEERQLVLWLLGSAKSDIRLRLSELLWSAALSTNFDYVIIDAPPRLSVGSINALLASTHYVVPTILDGLAAAPVENLLAQYRDMFNFAGVAPKLAGVAAMKTRYKALTKDEMDTAERVNGIIESYALKAKVYPQNIAVAQKYTEIAGTDFAYFSDQIRPAMKRLCEQIEASLD